MVRICNDGTSELQRHRVMPAGTPEPRPADDLDVVAYIRLNLRRNGAMSIEGNIGDKQFALSLLDNARDAIMRQIPDADALVVPSADVEVPEFGKRR